MSEAGSSVPPEGSKDRHEPRGRKPNDHLPPSRAREVQRAFRLRRAEHLASLEERILGLENENNQLRALLSLPEGDRTRIGSGPTGRGKALKEGGVPMSERVRARKEARERERRARGLPEASTSESERDGRDSATLSPRAGSSLLPESSNHNMLPQPHPGQLPLFSPPNETDNYNFLSMPFGIPQVSPDSTFPDFVNNMDTSFLLKDQHVTDNTRRQQNFGMFNLFDGSSPMGDKDTVSRSPITPSISTPSTQISSTSTPNTPLNQPDLLTRLKACCHLSDSHVVNDPGLLIFATRLCQSFPCTYGGIHPVVSATSDNENMLLDDSWRALRAQLDPGGEADGENRINTGRMAAELVIRAAASRGGSQGGWILCRYREGMSIKKMIIAGLVAGFGGTLE